MTWTDPYTDDPTVSPFLATGSYYKFTPEMGVPVRSTVGTPRRLRYPLEEWSKLVTPFGVFGTTDDPAEFRTRYVARLIDKGGQTEVSAELGAIRDRHPDRRIVLLCYCDVTKPDGWCHRRIFAEWFEQFTGLTIPELTLAPGRDPHPAVPEPTAPAEPELTLFTRPGPSVPVTRGHVNRPGRTR